MNQPLVLSAGHQLRSLAGSLADAVVACEWGRHPDLRARYGGSGRARSREDAACHLATLADAVDAGSPALFNDYIGWVQVLLLQRDLKRDDLDHHLECMADVLRQGLPPAVAAPAAALVDGARAALPQMPVNAPECIDDAQPLAPLARDYLHALLGGYRQAAAELLFDAAERGVPVPELYLQVLQPALREIGRLWQTRHISVAQEHFCSLATQIVMAQLRPRASAAARNGRSVVVACVSGELHEVGARMVGDFFEMAGWDSYGCGANTPPAAVVQAVVDRRADVLAVSATMVQHLHRVQELVELVRAEPRCAGLRVLAGGHPFNVDAALWRTLGADGGAADAQAAVAQAARWLA